MECRIIAFVLLITSLFIGCKPYYEKTVEYPNKENAELNLIISSIHVVLKGEKFVKNRKSILLVNIRDEDFGAFEDLSLDCFIVHKGRRIYPESLDQVSTTDFQIILKPTRSGVSTVVLKIKGKEINETLKLEIVVDV